MRALSLIATAAAVASLASVAVAQPMNGQRMEQITKMVCKTTRNSPITKPPECRGGSTMDSGPVCICPGNTQEFELPACEANGQPAMHPAGTLVEWRLKQRLRICEPYQADGSGGPRG